MSSYIISGIQQIGLGNANARQTWDWYRRHMGMDLPIFDEVAEANLMLPYTGGQARQRHAILAMNYQGGGGLEIWQYIDRTPQPPTTPIRIGDTGIWGAKYKAPNVERAYHYLQSLGADFVSEVHIHPSGIPCFYMRDLYGNFIEVTEGRDWHKTGLHPVGGIIGCHIAVSDMERSLTFYQDILGYDHILSDTTHRDPHLSSIPGGENTLRRVTLTHSKIPEGPFAPLLGSTNLELVQNLDITPKPIYVNRYWGDLGYIHLCYDVRNMDALEKRCASLGHSFTVDSASSFDMGEAAGRFAYVEDPDDTLIEFVEAHKVPLLPALGWYLNLKNRSPHRSLPQWILWAMGLRRKPLRD